jgi:hypothetical protein
LSLDCAIEQTTDKGEALTEKECNFYARIAYFTPNRGLDARANAGNLKNLEKSRS